MTKKTTAQHGPNAGDGPRVAKYFPLKYILDRIFAVVLVIPAFPVMLLLGIVVRVTSRGPAIYRQTRVGMNGSVFTMYKFRSMTVDAESKSGPVWTTEKLDNRVTWLGRILRKTHLDELPQLFNVLRGEMSLIGPRPERPEFVHVLEKEIPNYRDRLKVLPGITGLAQVNLPPDSDLNSVRRKQKLDILYIETVSPGLDLRMILATILRMIGVRGTRVVNALGLARKSELAAEEISNLATVAATPSGIATQTTVGESDSAISLDAESDPDTVLSDSSILR